MFRFFESLTYCTLAVFFTSFVYADTLQVLTDAEAVTIVESREVAKERSKDEREEQLSEVDALETAVADLQGKRVVFNRIVSELGFEGNLDTPAEVVASSAPSELSFFDEDGGKQLVNLTLSGTVYDGVISELWWWHEGERYRIFTNANFLLFNGVGEFEDADTRYSVFSILSERSTENAPPSEEWRPTLADFSPNALEYYIADAGVFAALESGPFRGVVAMLQYYAENQEQMQIAYDNSQKLRDARRAYLKANPPKKRDTIINFRPTGKSVAGIE